MSAVAQRAGISKQTLSSIENGSGNPTVETLAMISAALDVPVRRLLTEWGTPVFVQRAVEASWFEGETHDERTLDEVYGSGYVRTSLVRLRRAGDDDQVILPHSIGALHHIYVVSGRIRTGPAAEPVDLASGDFTRFPGDVAHLIQALSERAMAHIVTTEPQLRQVRS